MLICHKRVASNEAEALQACHVSDVHATSALQGCYCWVFPPRSGFFMAMLGLWVLILKFTRNLGFKKVWDRNLQNAYTNNSTLSLCCQIQGCDVFILR